MILDQINISYIFFYFVAGVSWAWAMAPLWVPNADGRRWALALSGFLNIFLWWFCIIIYFASKLIRGKDTLL
jgi:hypothetical protein